LSGQKTKCQVSSSANKGIQPPIKKKGGTGGGERKSERKATPKGMKGGEGGFGECKTLTNTNFNREREEGGTKSFRGKKMYFCRSKTESVKKKVEGRKKKGQLSVSSQGDGLDIFTKRKGGGWHPQRKRRTPDGSKSSVVQGAGDWGGEEEERVREREETLKASTEGPGDESRGSGPGKLKMGCLTRL